MITFALWLEHGLWHFVLCVGIALAGAVSLGTHVFLVGRLVVRQVVDRRADAKLERAVRPPEPPRRPRLAVETGSQRGAAALLTGPLPRRIPGIALSAPPAEPRPSLDADGVDVVTWAIRIARRAANDGSVL